MLVNVNGAGSSDPDGSIASYAWVFSDGHTATGPLASNTFVNPGSYSIKLTVTDNGGSSRSTTTTVVAGTSNQKPVPVLTALPTTGPAPLAVSLSSAGSFDPDGNIVKYAWDFGNGTTAAGTTTQVTYATAGSFTITLTVTDNRGAVASTTENVVADPPVPATDRMRVQLTGALSDVFDGPISSGNLRVVKDSFGVSSISGSAGFVGAHGPGTVTVSLSRFLIFNAFSGTITVSDPGAGITQSTTVLLTPLSQPSATSVRGSVTGSTAAQKGYTLAFTFDDRA
jgi:PKD repeat protein